MARIGVTLLGSCSPSGPASTPTTPVTLVVPPVAGAVAEPGTPTSPAEVRFGRSPPAIGTHWSVDIDARSEVEVTGPTGTEVQISEYVSQFRVDVLAMEGQAPSKLRIEFGKNLQRYQGADLPTVVAGRAYVVDEQPPYVRADDGASVTPAEVERVLDLVPDLGARPGVEQALPAEPMAIGQARPEIAAAILRIIHPRAWKLEQGNAVLARAEPDEAIFRLTVEGVSKSSLRINVEGDARVRRRDAWLTAVELAGTFQSTDPSAKGGSFRYRRAVRE